jgi:hypothetical protein
MPFQENHWDLRACDVKKLFMTCQNCQEMIDSEEKDLLENEKIGGESLIDHAQRLDETTLKEIENYQPESEPIDSPGNEGIESELQATQVESQAIKDVTTRLTNIGSHHSPLNIFSLGTDQFMETGGEWDRLSQFLRLNTGFWGCRSGGFP